ncbi:MAG: guanylate kinase [Clostridia bacterium]|nr:guanylate kinase [Clostridia bacterium]
MNKGSLFIISGPSGTGKDTVLSEVFAAEPELRFSISSITRPMRAGEVEGEKYHFISTEEFEKLLDEDAFLEHNTYLGNYYGTPKQPVLDCIENGEDIFIEVDVNGARQILNKMPQAVSIFILPPSLEVLKSRLSKRGTETPEQLEKRLGEALREIRCADMYDYAIVNDKLEDAVADTLTVIRSERLRASRRTDEIRKLTENL